MGPFTRTGKRGYTLIELLIVLMIIAVLVTMAQPTFHRSIIRAKETSLRRSLFILRDVIDQYYADHGQYPDQIEDLVEKRYIRKVPEDPFTQSTGTWIEMPPEDDSEGAIYDVHSGSDLVGLDGVPYNEW